MDQGGSEYNVFLSYNSRDRENVAKIAAFLCEKGQRVFFDVSSIQGGDSWQTAIEKAIPSCQSFIIFHGREGLGPWQQDEIGLALLYEKRTGLKVIPVLLPGADPPLGFLELKRWISAKYCWDNATLDALSVALGITSSPVEPEEEVPNIPPYRGLLPFREEDAAFYFGRESFIQSLREAVTNNSLTALVGPSGSGKSSLVHAGLLPDLRKSKADFWQVVSMRPGPSPIHSLASVFVRLLEPGKPLEEQKSAADRLAESLLQKMESLESLSSSAGGTSPLLLVVDQWEELYTLAQDDETERNRFIEEILAATRSNSISVLILFRGDFYGRVMEHPELRRRLQGDYLIPLPDMSPADLRRAMEEPARKVDLEFETGLVDEILTDLEQQPGQLPLLEFVLERLWSERDRKSRKLLRSSYAAMGRLRGALARKADEITRALPEAEVRRLFLRLVRVEEDAPVTRRRTPLEELDNQAEKIASRFIESRLLVTGWDSKTGEEILEIAHEAIIQHWRRLRAWLEEDRAFLIWRDQLRHDLDTWLESGQKEAFLLTAGPLQVAEFWLEKHSDDLSAEAFGYIRLGLEKRGREKRRRSIRRAVAAGLVATLFGLAGIVIYLAVERAHARSRNLAAEALQAKDRGLALAMLLSLEAYKVAETVEAKGSLLSLLQQSRYLERYLPGDPGTVFAASFSPQGDLVAVGGKGHVYLWDAASGARLGDFLDERHQRRIVCLDFSPNGTVLATGSEDHPEIRFWSISDRRPLPSLFVEPSVQKLRFSLDGRQMAVSTGKKVLVWDLETRRVVSEIIGAGEWISSLAFSPDGEILAIADLAGSIILQRRDGSRARLVPSPGGQTVSIAFSPDGTRLATGGTRGVQLWDVASPGLLLADLGRGGDPVSVVAFSAGGDNGDSIAAADVGGKIRVWDLSAGGEGKLRLSLQGHGGSVWSLSFNPAGWLLSSGGNGETILWNPRRLPRLARVFSSVSDRIESIALDMEGGTMAASGDNGKVSLLSMVSGAPLKDFSHGHQGSVNRVSFADGGNLVVTGGDDGRVLIWEKASQRSPRKIDLPGVTSEDRIVCLAISPDGMTGAAGTSTGRIFTWRIDRGGPALEMRKRHEGLITALAFDPSGEKLVSAAQWELFLWSLASREMIFEQPEAHDDMIFALVFNPSGLLASGSFDRTVRLWKVSDSLTSYGGALPAPQTTSLAFDREGDFLAAGGADGTIALWDMSNPEARRPVGSGLRSPDPVESLAFDPTSRFLYTAGNQQIVVWDLSYQAWAREACAIANRSLSHHEWRKYLGGRSYREACPGYPRVRHSRRTGTSARAPITHPPHREAREKALAGAGQQ